MNALIVGYGSAGRRHFKALCLCYEIKKIFILTKQKVNNTKQKIKVSNLSEIKNQKIDLIVICNETYKHFYTLKKINQIFFKKIIIVEKPLFEKYYNFRTKKNSIFVFYNLRYHRVIRFIKKNINFKKIYYIESETSSYLPKWRKSIDYKKSYSSSKVKGGGALLDLSHEIDYILWIFKSFKINKIYKKKISNLKTSSDDFSLILGKISNKSLVKIKLSYFNMRPKRILNIFDNEKQIYADLLKNNIKIVTQKKITSYSFNKFSQIESTKEIYKDILNKKFFNLCTLNEGLKLLKAIEVKI